MKTYAVDIIGSKEPTYILEADVVKLYTAMNKGYKLILVGKSFINPSSIARIRRAYDVDASTVEETDQELIAQIEGKEFKKLT